MLCCLVAKSCPTLATSWTVALQVPVHGILQARILEWVASSPSRVSSRPTDEILSLALANGFFITDHQGSLCSLLLSRNVRKKPYINHPNTVLSPVPPPLFLPTILSIGKKYFISNQSKLTICKVLSPHGDAVGWVRRQREQGEKSMAENFC